MKIEFNTTEQFISEAADSYNRYMNKRLRNQPVHFYHLLKNNDIMESIIKKTRYHFYDDSEEGKRNRIYGEVSHSKVKQHLRQLWIIYKCVYR